MVIIIILFGGKKKKTSMEIDREERRQQEVEKDLESEEERKMALVQGEDVTRWMSTMRHWIAYVAHPEEELRVRALTAILDVLVTGSSHSSPPLSDFQFESDFHWKHISFGNPEVISFVHEEMIAVLVELFERHIEGEREEKSKDAVSSSLAFRSSSMSICVALSILVALSPHAAPALDSL